VFTLRRLPAPSSAPFCVLLDDLRVRRPVYAIDFVVGYVAMKPLDLGSQVAKYAERLLGCALNLLGRHISCAQDFTFDDKFWHCALLCSRAAHPSTWYALSLAQFSPSNDRRPTQSFQLRLTRSHPKPLAHARLGATHLGARRSRGYFRWRISKPGVGQLIPGPEPNDDSIRFAGPFSFLLDD
jgi:hypothetical protein